MSFASLTKAAYEGIKRHSPDILLGMGISGMISSTVLAVAETPKAMAQIEAYKKKHKIKHLTPVQAIRVAWKCYIPAAATCAVSTACVISSNKVHNKRNAALATAYAISENTLRSFHEKAIEVVGEKKEKEIRDAVARDRVKENPVSRNEVVMTNLGKTLCYDCAFGRYFYSDYDILRKAENEVNRRLRDEMYISLNEFYSMLELSPITIGYDLGWNMDKGYLELFISTQLADDGKTPCLAISYNIVPEYDFNKLCL